MNLEKLYDDNGMFLYNTDDYKTINGKLYFLIDNNLKEFKVDEREFELMKKVIIANEIRNSENKYKNFKSFTYKKEYSEDFLDIQFIKDLDYNRFNNYLAALNYDNYVIANIINSEEKHTKK